MRTSLTFSSWKTLLYAAICSYHYILSSPLCHVPTYVQAVDSACSLDPHGYPERPGLGPDRKVIVKALLVPSANGAPVRRDSRYVATWRDCWAETLHERDPSKPLWLCSCGVAVVR
ncbi:hypothetical protein C2E23DRAFT_357317 [Lenzites betulinus]|nr:hypothetical protein C2E23DRAFT_357317 [Lenzites betulinus]